MSESLNSKRDEYDPLTYHHWQEFEIRRLKMSGDDFQQLFEDIMVRARPREFERVRPYGRFGDRKCDGLIESEGIVFQVYSPDELKQAEVQKKIDEDLEGAVQHWSDILKKWVFVYNVKRGVPPDVLGTLQEKQKQYPGIKISHLSNDDLWEIARKLPVQQRAEILGAPPIHLSNEESGLELLLLGGQTSRILSNSLENDESDFIYPSPLCFFGREDTIERVSAAIQNNGTVVVGGIPGIGKTALAAKLAQQLDNQYSVLWLDCESYSQFEQVIVKIASFLSMRFGDHHLSTALKLPNTDSNYYASIAVADLCKHHCLFIWDQFECRKNQSLIPLLKLSSQLGQQSKLLITTQEWSFTPELLNPPLLITISELSWQESLSLMRYHAHRLEINEPTEDVFRLAYSRIDGHPYFLCLLITLSEVFPLHELLDEIPRFTDEAHAYIQKKVFDILSLDAQQLLLDLSVLRFPFQLSAIKIFTNSTDGYKAFEMLVRRFVITRVSQDTSYYVMHSLVKEWCSFRDPLLSSFELHKKAVEYYQSLPEKRYLDALELIYHALKASLLTVARESAEKVLMTAIYNQKYDLALNVTSNFLSDIKTQEWGFIHHFRGRALRFKERLEEAIGEYESSLSKSNDSFYRYAAKSEIASLILKLVNQEQRQDKVELYKRASKYCNELLSTESPRIKLNALTILGFIEADTGNIEKGLSRLSDALEQAIKEDLPDAISGIYFNLAKVYEKLHRTEEQIECLKQSQVFQQQMLEKNGTYNIEAEYFTSLSLGCLYSQLKEYSNSIRSLERCVEIDRDLDIARRLAHSLYHLGRNHCLIKEFGSAYSNLQETLELIQKNSIKDEGAERHALAWLTVCSWYLCDFEKAVEFYLEHSLACKRQRKLPYIFFFVSKSSVKPDTDFLMFHDKQSFMLALPAQYRLEQIMQLNITKLVERRPELEQEAASLRFAEFEKSHSKGFGKDQQLPNQKCPCGSGKKYKLCCGKKKRMPL
jgi:tetratricopeptide (TPR) repeat protein